MVYGKHLRSAWTVLWKSLLFLVVWGLLSAPFALLIGRSLEGNGADLSWSVRFWFDASGLLSILVAAWIMVRFVDRRPFVSLGFEPARIARDSTIGIAVAAFMALLTVSMPWIGGWLELRPPPSIASGVLLFAGVSLLLNAALQEMLCRSYVFQTIRRHTNSVTAVALTSLLFVLLHAGAIQSSLLAASNLFLAGVLLGTAYASSENLWLPIALHFVWNFSLGPVLGLSVSGQTLDVGHRFFELGGPALWTGGEFGIEASLGATLATLAGIGFLLLVHRRRRRLPTLSPSAERYGGAG